MSLLPGSPPTRIKLVAFSRFWRRNVEKSSSELHKASECESGEKPPAGELQSPGPRTGAPADGQEASSSPRQQPRPAAFIQRHFEGQTEEEKTQVSPCWSAAAERPAASLSTVLMAFISPASCAEPGHRHRDSADSRSDMAEEAPAAAPAKAPAKAPKKKSAPRPKKDGPSLPKLIVGAVAESKERKGTSLAALKKALAAKGVDVTKANKRVNTAVIKLVAAGTLTQTRGTGAAGSFKLAKKEPQAAKPAKKVVPKKPAAKAKKPAAKAKKPAAAKKVAAKKVAAKKVAAKKSPKKSPAKKPAKKVVKKSPKKAAANKPKAAKRPQAKKTPAKKPAAKKAKK